MKILYIDCDGVFAPTRAEWIRNAHHEVDISSGLRGPDYKSYDLAIINLGERGSEFDLRPEITKFGISGAINARKPVIFTGVDSKDEDLTKLHGGRKCALHELSQGNTLKAILEKATGRGLVR